MQFTETQQEILFRAWALSHEGSGQVLTEDAEPEARDLAAHGWLEERTEPNGDTSWWWTPAADQAFQYGAAMNSADGRQN